MSWIGLLLIGLAVAVPTGIAFVGALNGGPDHLWSWLFFLGVLLVGTGWRLLRVEDGVRIHGEWLVVHPWGGRRHSLLPARWGDPVPPPRPATGHGGINGGRVLAGFAGLTGRHRHVVTGGGDWLVLGRDRCGRRSASTPR